MTYFATKRAFNRKMGVQIYTIKYNIASVLLEYFSLF